MDSTVLPQDQTSQIPPVDDSAQNAGATWAQPFGLDYQPQAPVGAEHVPIVEETPEQLVQKQEQAVETVQEIFIPTESLAPQENNTPSFEPPIQVEEEKIEEPDLPIASVIPPASVIDQTDKLTSLHHIVDTTDPLTQEADKEEEEFIEQVEKHHEHQ